MINLLTYFNVAQIRNDRAILIARAIVNCNPLFISYVNFNLGPKYMFRYGECRRYIPCSCYVSVIDVIFNGHLQHVFFFRGRRRAIKQSVAGVDNWPVRLVFFQRKGRRWMQFPPPKKIAHVENCGFGRPYVFCFFWWSVADTILWFRFSDLFCF